MTYQQWEATLLNYLKSLSKGEKDEIVGYYREMYDDKRDSGFSEDDITAAFGDPMLAAARILKESDEEGGAHQGEAREEESAPKTEEDVKNQSAFAKTVTPVLNKIKATVKETSSNLSIAKIVGWFFLTVLILIPLAAVLIGIIATLASLAVAGAAMAVGGAVGALASPLLFAFGFTVSGVLIAAGGALITSGVGAVLFLIFYYITKYSVISTVKVIKYSTRRKSK